MWLFIYFSVFFFSCTCLNTLNGALSTTKLDKNTGQLTAKAVYLTFLNDTTSLIITLRKLV